MTGTDRLEPWARGQVRGLGSDLVRLILLLLLLVGPLATLHHRCDHHISSSLVIVGIIPRHFLSGWVREEVKVERERDGELVTLRNGKGPNKSYSKGKQT